MKAFIPSLLLATLAAARIFAADTIDATARYGYGANTGWINFEGDAANGAVIGEYVASGYIHSANCGWIHLGDGTPVNGIQYQNNSAADFGVNLTNYACPAPGVHTVDLSGYAYGANIGWINFTSTGNPRIDLGTGKLRGYAWSANTGWINLGELSGNVNVITNSIQPAADTDTDGIADAYEYTHAGLGDLASLTATGDADGDGLPDVAEYAADTDPFDPLDRFRITVIAPGAAANAWDLTFTTKLSRVYQIQEKPDLLAPVWADLGSLLKPDVPTTTATVFALPVSDRQFWRSLAKRPLQP